MFYCKIYVKSNKDPKNYYIPQSLKNKSSVLCFLVLISFTLTTRKYFLRICKSLTSNSRSFCCSKKTNKSF